MRSNLLKQSNLMLRSEQRERLEAWAASGSSTCIVSTSFDSSHRVSREMLQQQLTDAERHLVRCKVAAAGKHFEAIGRRDEISRAFGCDPSDGVVGIAPDRERRHANDSE